MLFQVLSIKYTLSQLRGTYRVNNYILNLMKNCQLTSRGHYVCNNVTYLLDFSIFQ